MTLCHLFITLYRFSEYFFKSCLPVVQDFQASKLHIFLPPGWAEHVDPSSGNSWLACREGHGRTCRFVILIQLILLLDEDLHWEQAKTSTSTDGKCDGLHKGTTTIPPPTRQWIFPGDRSELFRVLWPRLWRIWSWICDVNSLVVFYLWIWHICLNSFCEWKTCSIFLPLLSPLWLEI